MNSKKLICVLLAMLTLLTLIGCQDTPITSSQEVKFPQSTYAAYDLTKYGNDPATILNGGLFVEKNGKLFYSNSEDGDCLYVYDGSTHTKLTDFEVRSLNADAEYIYFQETENDVIGRVKHDGSEHTVLYADKYNNNLLLYNGVLYFVDGDGFAHQYVIADGSDKALAPTFVSNLTVYDGRVFFLDGENYLCEFKENSFSRRKDLKLNYFVINNNWVYFADSNGSVGKMQLDDGSAAGYLTPDFANELVLTKDCLLYFSAPDDNRLYVLDFNGDTKVEYAVVGTDDCDALAYVDGKIYYRNPKLLDTIRVLEPGDELAEDFVR